MGDISTNKTTNKCTPRKLICQAAARCYYRCRLAGHAERWNSNGTRQFELDNHLGNVTATITDKRIQHSSDNTTTDYFMPDVVAEQEYYAFGALMPGRSANTAGYRYGFNGKENDNDIGKGTGNQQDYGMRIYDPRIARFLSVDPIALQYPELTPYQFASNTPIQATDLDGLEAKIAISGSGTPLNTSKKSNTPHTAYWPGQAKEFENRAKIPGYNAVSVHNGQGLLDALKSATKKEGSISSVIFYGHGNSFGLFLDFNAGFYTSSYHKGKGDANVDELINDVKSGKVKFTTNATWIFTSCNAGNSQDPGWALGSGYNLEIARDVALKLHITTIGAGAFVEAEKKNGKYTGFINTTNEGCPNMNLQFIKFTPIKSGATYTIKEENIGTTIDPAKYITPVK